MHKLSLIEQKDGDSRKRFSLPVEIKEITDEGKVTGYGSVFGIEDSYGDVVDKGAFLLSLKERMPKMLYQHNPSDIVGKWTVANEDSHGLFLEGQIMKQLSKGQEVLTLLKEKVLDGLSIGFRTRKAFWDEKDETRHLTQVDLMEVSFVTFPALEQALVTGVKNARTFDKREIEQILRDAGLPNKFAKTLLAKGWDAADGLRSEEHRDDGGLGDLAALLRKANDQLKHGVQK